MLHGHGDDAYRHPGVVKVNFSSNVLPGGLPRGLKKHLEARLATACSYPEVAAETLTARLAQQAGVTTGNVLVTNGATAAIWQIAQAFRSHAATVITPTFAEYADACAANDNPPDHLPWKKFAAGAEPPGGLVWCCNPNNPTGAVIPAKALLARAAARSRWVLVIDQAYAGLCAEKPITARAAVEAGNILLVRSLTKRHAIPGLRLGAVFGAERLLAELRRFSAPWSVNTLALAAGEFIARGAEQPGPPRGYLARAREFRAAVARVPGVEVMPSATGFFLFQQRRDTAAVLKAHLSAWHGFLVRDAGNFAGLDASWCRVATQGRRQDAAFVRALASWISKP